MIDKELLEILACPACKGDVELKDDKLENNGLASYGQSHKLKNNGLASYGQSQKIICKKCGKKYPIRDGIPIMLINEAES